MVQVHTLIKAVRKFSSVYSINTQIVQRLLQTNNPILLLCRRMATNGSEKKETGSITVDMSQEAIELERKKRKEEARQAKQDKYDKKRQQQQQQQQQQPAVEANSEQKQAHKPGPGKSKAGDSGEYKWNHEPGEKKDTTRGLPDTYMPRYVEAAWYEWWEKQGFFTPEYGRATANAPNPKGTFMICIPPPNVTGSLHLGHALTQSIEDAVVRWQRCRGKTTLWNPGCDHAGIATQVVVEKKLMREQNLTRHDIGREEFLKLVWSWKEEKEGRIYEQIKLLGSSCDWNRAFFTMDSKLYSAVTEAFIKLHRDGLIYRANRLVNWSCELRSAISDIEVDKKELAGRTLLRVPNYDKPIQFGILVSFAYPVVGGGEIVVATTRPETMLGDTAVAVNPKDPRYTELIGRSCQHPFLSREIPIVADESVNMEFGTGAVKITPAHDHNDYEIGNRHKLEFIEVIDQFGIMKEICGPQFAKKKRFDCRTLVIEALKEKGLHKDTVEHEMVVPVCSRSKDIIEPLLKPQWYLNCDEMSREAVEAVKSGRMKIVPNSHEKVWFSWLENCRHWCISRQLWWGHRIPAYSVSIQGHEQSTDPEESWVSGRTEDEAREFAAKKYKVSTEKITLKQDEDVLDTWFSSGLLPMSIFGWPNTDNAEYRQFYPGSLLETGHDILFFWVARMVMFALKLTGEVPFKEVYLHAMVRDAHGRKMSKSFGNVIDPLDVRNGITLEQLNKLLEDGNLDPKEIEKAKEGQKRDYPDGIAECGTDAMRFGLCAYTAQGRDINLDIKRIVAYKHFCNKIWNGMNFIRDKLGGGFVPLADERELYSRLDGRLNSWVMSRLAEAVDLTNQGFETYNFPQATTAAYNFWLYDLCDVYLEAVKPVMLGDNKEEMECIRQILYTCSETALRLFSPFMPFITEELFQRLPRRNPAADPPSICVTPFPESLPTRRPDVEKEVQLVQELVHVIRRLRSEYLDTKVRPVIILQTQDPEIASIVDKYSGNVLTLGRIDQLRIDSSSQPPEGCTMSQLSDKCSVFLLVKGVVDIPQEIKKLTFRREKVVARLQELLHKIQQPNYEKVPDKVKGENDRNLGRIEAELAELDKVIQSLTDIDK